MAIFKAWQNTGWLTDSAIIHKWIRPSPITLWRVIFIFVISRYFQQEIKFWLIHLAVIYVSSMFESHIFTRCFPFLFLNPLKSFWPIFFSSFGWQHLHSWVYSCFLLVISTNADRADFLFLYFQINRGSSSFL